MPPESVLNSRAHFYYDAGFVGNYWRMISKAQAERAQKFIEKTRFLEQAANSIAPPSDPPETRLRKLYAKVQQVRYRSYEPSRTAKEEKSEHLSEHKTADDILRHNYAYANETNYLFTAGSSRSEGTAVVQVITGIVPTTFSTTPPHQRPMLNSATSIRKELPSSHRLALLKISRRVKEVLQLQIWSEAPV